MSVIAAATKARTMARSGSGDESHGDAGTRRPQALPSKLDEANGLWHAFWENERGRIYQVGMHPTEKGADALARDRVAERTRSVRDPSPASRGTRGPYKELPRVISPRPIWNESKTRALAYYGRFLDLDGRQKNAGRHRTKDAAKKAAEARCEALRRRIDKPEAETPIGHFTKEGKWPAAQMDDSQRQRLVVAVSFMRAPGGETPVGAITRDDIYVIKDKLVEDGYAPDYIRKILGSVSALFSILVDREIVGRNPAERIRISGADRDIATQNAPTNRKKEEPGRFISPDEFAAYCSSTAPELAARLAVGIAGGLRPGELLAVHPSKADRATQMIKLNESVSKYGKLLRGTKTTHHEPDDKNFRWTTCPAFVLDDLVALGVPIDEYLFLTPRSLHWGRDNFRNKILKPTMDEFARRGGQPFRLKDLRHTWDTLLLEGRIPPTHVAAWAGHAVTIEDAAGRRHRMRSLTIDVYNHPTTTHVPAAVELIRDYLAPARAYYSPDMRRDALRLVERTTNDAEVA
jgi:integrase